MLTVKNALAKSVILLVHILLTSLLCRISVVRVIIPSGLQKTPGEPIEFFLALSSGSCYTLLTWL
jgi:hypothetical protein